MLITLIILNKGNYIIKLPYRPNSAIYGVFPDPFSIIFKILYFYTFFLIYQYKICLSSAETDLCYLDLLCDGNHNTYIRRKFSGNVKKPCLYASKAYKYGFNFVFHYMKSMSIIGIKMAGSIFPTLIFLISSILKPTPIRSIPPVAVISVTTASCRNGATADARSAIEPW